jgi:hypothetical protein
MLCESSPNCRTANGFRAGRSQMPGFRTVALPSVLVAVVRVHLVEFPPSNPEDLIFKGPMGAALRRNNFHRSVRWAECVAEAGLPEGFRFHDLRHTGNTLAASSGASTRELMHRMGHASMRAALIYQHATSKPDREIAAAIDERSDAEVTANGPLMARISQRARGVDGTIAPLTRGDAAERVTRIELAWPAWKESARPREPTRMRPPV